MQTTQLTIFIVVLFTGVFIPKAIVAEDDWSRTPGWLGDFWEATPELGKLLGIDSQEIEGKFPAKLHLSNFVDKEAAVAVMGEESLNSVEARFAKMKHKLISGGKWEAEPDFKGFAGKDAFFFVTKSDGATFLWFGTPQVTLKGAEVHYIHGVEPQHDLLVLDYGFTNFRARLYAGDTVGYQRADD